MESRETDFNKKIDYIRFKHALNISYERWLDLIDYHKNSVHIQELLYFDGKEFIAQLYYKLLKRPPDEAGVRDYLSMLVQGVSKKRIIRYIKNSDEAKKINVKICGSVPHSLRSIFLKNWLVQFIVELAKSIILFPKLKLKYERLMLDNYFCKQEISNISKSSNNMQGLIEELKKKIAILEHQMYSLTEEFDSNLPTTVENWDTLYQEFENIFRGPSEIIKQRLTVYLPYFDKLKKSENDLILDIGCGRGEWLQLLRENNMQAVGIDTNKKMVEECQKKQLSIINEDAIKYLIKQQNNTIKVITAFHIIEHLAFSTLVRLLKESYRTLQKEGMIILETPNPNNILVASCTFYFDPTHKRPLHPEFMQFLLKYIGFKNIEIIGLNCSTDRLKENSEANDSLNKFFHSSQDYAIIGYK